MEKRKKKIKIIYFIVFLFLYFEILYKALVVKKIFAISSWYTILFTLKVILICNLICKLFKGKVSKILTLIMSIVVAVYYLIQIIFYRLFSVPFSFSTIGLAGGALTFTDVFIDILITNIWTILVYFIPTIIFAVLWKKWDTKKYKTKGVLVNITLIVIVILTSYASLFLDKDGMYSAYNLYYNINAAEKNMETFGVLTSTRLDIQRILTGFEDKVVIKQEEQETPKEVKYNVMDIDFENLKANTKDSSLINAYEYIEAKSPSNQNDYTGYFKDKNLIFILAEGFNSIAIDKERTPTLYKLTNSGFVFNNFYTPVFLSTTGGEFQATTGLIPTQSILAAWKERKPTISFALGNSFSKTGYNAFAYHDWTYNYYDRDVTMKTLGFNNYMAKGNGLQKLMNCKWLPSDEDMINVTTNLYTTQEPFVTYYVTVSGHAPYNFGGGNSMSLKNKDVVSDLNYSTAVKAYLASQIELDKALEALINNLETAGVLDNTVIALVGDHYPYTLPIEEINTVSTYERDEIVEVNRSNFILWNSKMKENIQVDKVGSQIDVLPTLLNLFGLEYDSRLIMGQDILSEKPGLAIFSNRSWVSNFGTYFASSKEFKPKENTEIEEGYVDKINEEVANRFTMSNTFIKYKIYDKIFE